MSFRTWAASSPFVLGCMNAIGKFFGSIHWPRWAAFWNKGVYYKLTEGDHDRMRRMFKENYCIMLTRRGSHFTTHMIGLMSWIATGKWSHYAHALMNVEGDITNNVDFRLIEATSTGVHYSTFMEVFDCDSVCILKPRGVTLEDWTFVLDEVKASYGAKYDMLFDITEELNVSCVELIYKGLKRLPMYEVRFGNLLRLIEEHKNDLTPEMLLDCGDLDIIFEVRR